MAEGNVVAEFFVPRRVSDLERDADDERNGSSSSSTSYRVCVDGEFDVPPHQQLDDLTRLFDCLHHEKSPTALFTRPELFAVLYSYVKAMRCAAAAAASTAHDTGDDDDGAACVVVTRVARHKMCHELGERLRKLLQVALVYLKRRDSAADATAHASTRTQNAALEVCLRSTLKMMTFVVCHILCSVAPSHDGDDEAAAVVGGGGSTPASRSARKRRRRDDAAASGGGGGFGEDDSGVDMDGRELVLTSLAELCSPAVVSLWPGAMLEGGLLHLLFKTCLHLITQRANMDSNAQSISSAIALLLARVTRGMLAGDTAHDAAQLVSPMVELAMQSESAAQFLCRFVADLEQDEGDDAAFAARVLAALFERMSYAALYDVAVSSSSSNSNSNNNNSDGAGGAGGGGTAAAVAASVSSAAAKHLATFFSEVAKQSVSVTVKMAEYVLAIAQSESYDVRKAAVTCLAEMLMQRYTAHAREAGDDATRLRYVRELLFRVMDVNAFVRNHTVQTWARLMDARAVPRRFYLAVTDALVGRLADRNFLVRDAAMTVMAGLLRRNWYGHVLNAKLLRDKLAEVRGEAAALYDTAETLASDVAAARAQLQPASEQLDDVLGEQAPAGGDADTTAESNTTTSTTDEAVATAARDGANSNHSSSSSNHHDDQQQQQQRRGVVGRLVFYESALTFVSHVQTALCRAVALLESRTERDIVEAIKLIIACCEYRVDGAEVAFLRVLVMVFDSEVKIQLAVRDAFAEVIFNAFARQSGSPATRAMASAQKLIAVCAAAGEGEMSAVDRIVALLKLSPVTASRYLTEAFVEALWSIAEGSADAHARADERRTAMRLYSVVTRHCWRDVRTRRDSICDFLRSHATTTTMTTTTAAAASADGACEAGATNGDAATARRSCDNVLMTYAVASLQNEARDARYVPIAAGTDPRQHAVLRHVVTHLCRRTRDVASWMRLAEACVHAVAALCESPAVVYQYVLRCVGDAAAAAPHDARTRAQLYFLVGRTALKQLVAIEQHELQQLKALEEPAAAAAATTTAATTTATRSRGGGGRGNRGSDGGGDAMQQELGVGSHEYRRHVVQELAQRRRQAILAPGSPWSRYADDIVAACTPATATDDTNDTDDDEDDAGGGRCRRGSGKRSRRCRGGTAAAAPAARGHDDNDNSDDDDATTLERVCAVMALCQLMMTSDAFCAQHLDRLFALVGQRGESWVVKSNVVIALGDLACVHPNRLGPFLSQPTGGFVRLLRDADARVRAATVQVCSHLVLGDMLRVRDYLHIIMLLIADPDASIAQSAVTFVQTLVAKEKEKVGNLVPGLVTQLSARMPTDTFQLAMRLLLERVEGDKPTESLIERLCARFGAYAARHKARQQLARNVAFCLAELNYTTERAVRRIVSEGCYQHYKHWLRDDVVLDCFRSIAAKAKRAGRFASERRDRCVLDEWEARMLRDAQTRATRTAATSQREAQQEEEEEEQTQQSQQQQQHDGDSDEEVATSRVGVAAPA